MDGKPGPPEEQQRQHTERAPVEQPASPAEVERLGPLALRRMRKDDGRALIVYSRVPAS